MYALIVWKWNTLETYSRKCITWTFAVLVNEGSATGMATKADDEWQCWTENSSWDIHAQAELCLLAVSIFRAMMNRVEPYCYRINTCDWTGMAVAPVDVVHHSLTNVK